MAGLAFYLAALVLLLAVGFFCLGSVMEKAGTLKPIGIAVVVPGKEDQATRRIMQYISSMESMRQVCKVQFLEEEKEAVESLQQGELQAVILFPEQFYQDIYDGKKTILKILYPRDSSLNIRLFQELLYDGVSMVRTSEAGVYAAMDAAREIPCEVGIGETGDLVAYSYGRLILKRGRLFSGILLSAAGDVDYSRYYFTGLFLMILLLIGMCFGNLYKQHSRCLEQKLRIQGVGCIEVSISRILVMWVHLWFTGILIYSVGCICSRISDFQPVFWNGTAVAFLGIPTLSIAVHHHMIYAVAGKSGGPLFLFLTDLLMMLCSGLVIPVAYLPSYVAAVSGILPLTWWYGLCLQIFYGTVTGTRIVWMVLLILVEAGIGTWGLWKKL